MRTGAGFAIGGFVLLVAYAVSRSSENILGAAAFVIAVFLVPVLIGTGIAVGISSWQERRMRRRSFMDGQLGAACGVCGGVKVLVGDLRICSNCDATAISQS